MNWAKIRNEYINGHISYRKLAEKHDISFSTLTKRATQEKWNEKRKEQRNKIDIKVQQKTAEKIAEKQADFAAELQSTANELLKKIHKAVQETDIHIERSKLRVPKKVKDNKTGEVYTAWQEEETIKLSKKDGENIRTLLELTNALKTLQTMAFTDKGETTNEAPSININISAATADDIEEE